MNDKISVFVADDHHIIRQGFVKQIESDPSFEVAGEASNGKQAFALIKNLKPDIALLDIKMPGMNGLEIAQKCMEENLGTSFVVLTMYEDEEYFSKAMDIGVMGYLLKENTFEDLILCLKAVASGERYVTPLLSQQSTSLLNKMEALKTKTPSLERLTLAEKRVLKLIAECKSSKEIADRFLISHRTVEKHRANICKKLEIKGANQLLRFALEHKILLSAVELKKQSVAVTE